MSRQVDLGQIVPNIQIGTTATGSPSTPASVVNVGTDLNPIFNFTIPKGDPGAIKMQIVNVLPETGEEDTIYLVPNTDPETQNNYDEYVYVNGQWEKLGGVQVEVDLTDYVKNTDYATSTKGGVFKTNDNLGTNVRVDGMLQSTVRNYATYTNDVNYIFISKGTLENVITGKGLVNNTSYASYSTGGVLKLNSNFGTYTNNGFLVGTTRTYEQYTSDSDAIIVSKGTLENVLNARIGDIQTLLDNLNNGNGVE